MPGITSIQTETTPENLAAKSRPSDDTLAFAKLLAATVQNQAQSSLTGLAGQDAGGGYTPFDSRFAQLAFLNQPDSLMLPSFMASPLKSAPANTTNTVNTADAAKANSVAASALPTSSAVSSALGREDTNPFPVATRQLGGASALTQSSLVTAPASVSKSGKPVDLSAFPRPANDNGRGIHWIPTPRQSPDVIDKYVGEAQSMGIKWVTLLNDGLNKGDNDYLVDKLTDAGVEPVMRLYTDGGSALDGDVGATVRHYGAKGVHYFQLYNEPNLRIENQGKAPDPKAYAAKWLADARPVVAAGGLPGFGSLSPTPGLAPGAAPGDMDDLRFLRESLQEVVRLGGTDVLEKTWLGVHNYGDAHLRVRDYDKVAQEVLGRSLPQVGTEAGIYPGDTLSQAQATEIVVDAYRYLPQREDYYFAYTYWIIANDPGQGQADAAWNHQALFRPDGNSPIVDVLKQEV